jgi:hypothetical protein
MLLCVEIPNGVLLRPCFRIQPWSYYNESVNSQGADVLLHRKELNKQVQSLRVQFWFGIEIQVIPHHSV